MKAKLVLVISLALFFGCANPGGGGDSTNKAPTATNISISGDIDQQYEDATGDYTYNDQEGDDEGTSTYQWIRYAELDPTCDETGDIIPGALARTYTLQDADNCRYLKFEVTPVAATGTADGTAVRSACSDQIYCP